MTLYAVERIRDAADAARGFLVPVDTGRWLRLAVLSLLVAGGAGIGGSGSGASSASGVDAESGGGFGPAVGLSTDEVLAAVLVVVALFAALALFVGLLSAVAEFALAESLRTERVTLWAHFSRFWWRGVRLFALRTALFIGAVAVLAVLAGAVALPVVLDAPLVAVAVALVAVPAALVAVAAATAADRFTVLFVVPTMLATDERSVLAGWRRFWTVCRPQWRQYAAYAGVAVALALVAGLLVGVAVSLLVAVLALPWGALFLLGIAVSTAAVPLGVALAALAAVGFSLSVLAVTAMVEVPVVTYLRFHALLVLGDTDAELDLLGERRPPLA